MKLMAKKCLLILNLIVLVHCFTNHAPVFKQQRRRTPPPSQQSLRRKIEVCVVSEQFGVSSDYDEPIIATTPLKDAIDQEYLNFEINMASICGDDLSDELGIVEILGKEKHKEAAIRSEAALRRIIELYEADIYEDEEYPIQEWLDAFNSCLNAWSRCNRPDRGERAEAVLSLIVDIEFVEPDICSFTNVLNAWAKSPLRDDVFHADQILRRMQDLYDSGSTNVEPDAICRTVVMQGWNRLAKKGDKNAPSRAHRILKNMEENLTSGKSKHSPDVFMYQIALNAWALSKTDEAAVKANEILMRMEGLYKEGNKDIKPTRKNYGAVIEAYLKKTNDFSRAESLLNQIENMNDAGITEMKPNESIYRAFVFACAKLGDEYGALKADHYLKIMLDKFEEGDEDMQPKTRTFNAVIEAWLHANTDESFRKIFDLVRLMEDLHQNGHTSSAPIERSYTNFVRSVSRNNALTSKAAKVQSIIDRMKSMVLSGNKEAAPSVYTYNAALSACADDKSYSSDKSRQAFETSIKLFNEVCKSKTGPDTFTYSNLLRVCELLPQESEKRMSVARAAFLKCCKDGLVIDDTVAILRGVVPPEVFEDVTGHTVDSFIIIPSEWSRNVKQKKNGKRR